MTCGGWTYIVTDRPNGALHIAVTADLMLCAQQHRTGSGAGYAHSRGMSRLVHFEGFDRMSGAIRRAQALRLWRRAARIALIEAGNPDWQDLWDRVA